MLMKNMYVYIITSQKNGTLYVGVTSNLVRRMYEHQNKIIKGFSTKYDVSMLVYYEVFQSMISAIAREKQIKKWNRDWKLKLIENLNSKWKDLSKESLSEEDFI